jgi:hypothetical protein
MALQRRAREAPGAGAGGLDRSRGAGGLGAEGRSPRPHGGILNGAGRRLMECVRLRVRVSTSGIPSTVRDGKGEEDRGTILPALLQANLLAHLEQVKAVHRKDLEEGFGEVDLPFALARKYPRAGREWGDSARPVLRPAGASVPFLSRRNGGNLSF